MEPKYFKMNKRRGECFPKLMIVSRSEDLSSEVEDEDEVVRTDKDEEWHNECSDDSDDKSWSPGTENSSSMQNELEIKVVVTEPKKRKRGRPKKGTGTGETTKEKILKSKASIVRVTKSMKINQFKQSYHNGTFSQMPGNGMNFRRQLISNGQIKDIVS